MLSEEAAHAFVDERLVDDEGLCAGGQGGQAIPEVLLIVPPFLKPGSPALGAEILAAACRSQGMDCDVLYANLSFAARVGDATYRRIMIPRHGKPLGEAVFAQEVYSGLPHPAPLFATATENAPNFPWDEPAAGERCYDICRAQTPGFLEETAAAVADLAPKIVGFTATVQQTMASLAIAKTVKALRPEIFTMLGGDASRLPMGQALAEIAPMLDCVVAGEADLVFPHLCQDYLQGGASPPWVIECAPPTELDQVAAPDYSSYLRQLGDLQAAGGLPETYPNHLLFESSRGCWWADKSRCRFCGLVHAGYRRKSGARIVAELRAAAERHPGVLLQAADCVMPSGMPHEILPELIEDGFRHPLQWAIRPDLTPAELLLMKKAGFAHVQPGIESLCPSILTAFRKGARAHQNIALLREGRSLHLDVTWNFLFRIPGDDLEEYAALVRLLPALSHLQPPMTFSSIVLQRTSPFLEDAGRFGFHEVRPSPVYRYLYPPETRIADIALDFQGRWHSALDEAPELRADLEESLRSWMTTWRDPGTHPALFKVPLAGGRVVVQDTRPCAKEAIVLGDAKYADALAYFDAPRTKRQAEEVAGAAVADLLERGFVIDWDDRYLSLVTRGHGTSRTAE